MCAAKKGKPPTERAYGRLTMLERKDIERALGRGEPCRKIARGLGRSPSTVKREVDRHRFVTSPKSLRGEPAPEDLGGACPKLGAWPRCCNGCSHKGGYGCSRKPKVAYVAKWAQATADAELSESRSGIDETEESAEAKLRALREGTGRGLSPAQIALMGGPPASTGYRWIDRGYAEMTNLGNLRRKTGYRLCKKRKRAVTRHSPSRSHAAFLALGEDACAAAWEMDTVEGSAADSARLLTVLHRPSRFQAALLIPDGTCGSVLAALRSLSEALGGPAAMRRVFGTVLTDNGSEFADEAAIGAVLGERPGEVRLFYCDPRQSQQKGACERNHVEIRKMLPKVSGIRFDLLTGADVSLAMSHVNSEPRGALAWGRPVDALEAAFGDDARALMAALGVEAVGIDAIDLTPGLVGRAREERGDPPLTG
ncbi:MAG: IS30 family transposase [Coriobacteriia bacterium]|nr:IS30 family transposase [Coriobacteriia bacterium]MBS5477699.1 IS30 family transposase [Coriobacteriia bacterium]